MSSLVKTRLILTSDKQDLRPAGAPAAHVTVTERGNFWGY